MHASYSKSMLSNILDRIKLSFRKDKELYLSLYKIIGFYPHNIELYKTALLHKSIARKNEKGKPVNNERLEFLGDAHQCDFTTEQSLTSEVSGLGPDQMVMTTGQLLSSTGPWKETVLLLKTN